MTLRPGPPYEWDEDKREDTLRIRGVVSCLWSGLTGRLRSTSGVTGTESSVTLPTCRSGTGCTTWSGRQEVPKPASSASGSRTGGRQPGTNKRKPNLVRPTGKEEAEIAAQLAEDPDTYEWTEEDWANAQTTQELFPEAHEWAVRQKEALKDGFIQWGDRHPGPGDDSLVQGPDGGGWEHRRDAVDGAVAQTLRDHAHGGRKSEA